MANQLHEETEASFAWNSTWYSKRTQDFFPNYFFSSSCLISYVWHNIYIMQKKSKIFFLAEKYPCQWRYSPPRADLCFFK